MYGTWQAGRMAAGAGPLNTPRGTPTKTPKSPPSKPSKPSSGGGDGGGAGGGSPPRKTIVAYPPPMPQRPPPSPGRPPAQTVKASPPPPPATTRVAAKPGGPVAVTDTEIEQVCTFAIPRPSNPHHPRNIKTLGSNSAVQALHHQPFGTKKGNIHVRNDHPLVGPSPRWSSNPRRAGRVPRHPAQGVSPAPAPMEDPSGGSCRADQQRHWIGKDRSGSSAVAYCG